MMSETRADEIAGIALRYLASQEELLVAFLGESGLTPQEMRAASDDGSLQRGVLDYVVGNESILVACAAHAQVAPEDILRAQMTLSPPAQHSV
ncbi:MAG: DUF3572 family protein [Pseudomonadota bacterium]